MLNKKKLSACVLAINLLCLGAALEVNAKEIPFSKTTITAMPRSGEEGLTSTLAVNKSWKSQKYYAQSGTVSAYAELFGSGKVSVTIYYHSSSTGSGTKKTSMTVTSGQKELYYNIDKAGYYSAEVKNIGSSSVTVDCGITVD